MPYWIAGIVTALAVLAVYFYNRLIQQRNRVDGAWSDIEVQLQRRHDLVPQLVKAVDQYAKYERATIEAVTLLREEALRAPAGGIAELGRTEERLSDSVRRLLALAEQYPDLNANENFLELQRELVETENYLQFARRYYNGAVREFNTATATVPGNIVAGLFRFRERPYFQKTADEAGSVPLVRFGSIE